MRHNGTVAKHICFLDFFHLLIFVFIKFNAIRTFLHIHPKRMILETVLDFIDAMLAMSILIEFVGLIRHKIVSNHF